MAQASPISGDAVPFTDINAYLEDQGVQVSVGTIVDGTIIDAPSSTKNQCGQRDPQMHQTKHGNQWYFGMKGHFGVDSRTKLIHVVVVTAKNAADGPVWPDLLHGDESRVWGDKAYDGQHEAITEAAPAAQHYAPDKNHHHRPLSAKDSTQPTGINRQCVRRSSIRSARSSWSSVLVRCATAALPKMPTGCSSPVDRQIFFRCDDDCRWRQRSAVTANASTRIMTAAQMARKEQLTRSKHSTGDL